MNFTPVLVKDINPGGSYYYSNGSYPYALTELNGILFFTANNGSDGNELWKSDGTAAGTVLVKDINSGGGYYSGGSYPGNLVAASGSLFFSANDGVNGTELWKSDGTDAGTVLVKDVSPGSNDFYYGGSYPNSSFPSNFTEVNGSVFFTANDGTNGTELWKSDGTEAGTVLVKDIYPGSGTSYYYYGGSYPNSSFPGSLTEFNGSLFFSANDGDNGTELWKSDGTEAGTVLVKDINQTSGYYYYYGGGGSSAGSFPSNFTNVNGTLFFTANDGVNGNELWKSDGTEAGTVLVKDLNGGSSYYYYYNSGSYPSNLTDVNGTLFFTTNNGFNSAELWKSDGTEAGTVLVKDINIGSSSYYYYGGAYPSNLTNVDGTLFFTVNDGPNGNELWKSDGTAAGTELVANIAPGSFSANPRDLTDVNGTLFFTATDGFSGRELWTSDGTEAGTVLAADILPGYVGANPSNLLEVDGTLFFTADDGTNGRELWAIAPEPSEKSFYFSGTNDRTVGNLTFASDDIVFFNGTDFEIAFDGSDVLPQNNDINAFSIISETEILITFAKSMTLDGLGRVDNSDVVKFVADAPDDLGPVTTGQFELYMDGSDLGLTSASERIDGLTQLANGDLLISTVGNAQWDGGLSTKGQDIVQFSPSSTGDDTSGSVSQFFDGSDVGLTNSSEKLDAIALDDDQLLFSTVGNWSVSNTQSGRREDIGQFDGSSFGPTTTGSFADGLAFDGSEFGFTGNLSGLDYGV